MRKLIEGILDFRANRRLDYAGTFSRLAHGQSPDALYVACSDSRVVANVFASTEPGDLFVLRNVGNIIPPCSEAGCAPGAAAGAGAAVEFAVSTLGVADIIVCGHSSCGAMRALCAGAPPTGAPNLQSWLAFARPVLQRLRLDGPLDPDLPRHDQLSQLNVLAQLDHLRTYPVVNAAIAAGRLHLHGWWFDIANAEVEAFDDRARRFVPIDEEYAAVLGTAYGMGTALGNGTG